jgi:adenylate kinase family enzyme
MRFILGAPCSGKGTITSNLKEFKSISAGNLLRELCETEKYSYLKKTLSEGGLVATDLICEILIEEAKKYHYDVFIDGFPRTLDQAIVTKKFLLDNNIQMKGVFYIIANDSLLIERTLTRTYCNE